MQEQYNMLFNASATWVSPSVTFAAGIDSMLCREVAPECCHEKSYAVEVEVLSTQHWISPYQQMCVLIFFYSDLSISQLQLVVSSNRSDIDISAYSTGIFNDRHLHILSYNVDQASEKLYYNPTGILQPPCPGPLVLLSTSPHATFWRINAVCDVWSLIPCILRMCEKLVSGAKTRIQQVRCSTYSSSP